jgi:signal transduction histidine kinase
VSSDDFLLQTQALTESDAQQVLAIGDKAWAQAGTDTSDDPDWQARAHSLLAAGALSQGELADAVTHGQMAMGLALALGRSDLLASALHPTTTALIRLGEHEQAIELFEARQCLAPASEPASLVQRMVNDITEAQAWLGYARSLSGAGGAASLALALAQARTLAERAGTAACDAKRDAERDAEREAGHEAEPASAREAMSQAAGQAAAGGGVPRLRILAFEVLTDVLLEAGDADGARAWRERLRDGASVRQEASSWPRVVFQLNSLKIDMHGRVEPARDLACVTALEAASHACFQSGRRRRELMQCLWQAYERCGDFHNALNWRKRWVEAMDQVEAVRVREQLKLTQRALRTLRDDAQHFITQALSTSLQAANKRLMQVHEAETGHTTRSKLHKAARSTQRALDIANQYLHVMNAEYTQRQELRPVDLGEIARDVCTHASLQLPTAVVVQPDIEPGVRVLGEPGLLSRALANLVENARAHAPAGSLVRVQLRCFDGVAVLSVSDQGPGLPLAMRTRLFERYASGRADGGNGLGLALVARVARLHDARVAVQTQEGQGTTVSLSMKAMVACAEADAA